MCGIFGYAGADANPEVLVEGIKRLEYRGYDSWGICVACDDQPRSCTAAWAGSAAVAAGDIVLPAAGLPGGDRAHALGDARRSHRSQRASPRRLHGQDRRHPQRHHREPRGAARPPGGAGPPLPQRDRHRGHSPPHRGVPEDPAPGSRSPTSRPPSTAPCASSSAPTASPRCGQGTPRRSSWRAWAAPSSWGSGRTGRSWRATRPRSWRTRAR